MSYPNTCLQTAYEVLKTAGKPMTSTAIGKTIMDKYPGVLSSKTPDRSVNARISQDIKRNREKSAFKRVGKGLYGLRFFNEQETQSLDFQKKIFPGDKIFVFSPNLLNSIGNFHGIKKDYSTYSDQIFTWDNYNFAERATAEKTDKFKQVVSYIIITYKDMILQYKRGFVSNVKDYLYGYLSIGIGGHVQLTDFDLFHTGVQGYLNSARREVEEETGIIINDPNEPRIIGVLNDDSSFLGRHHFAFIHIFESKSGFFEKGEKSINGLRFVRISDLGKEFARYEYWSKLCILNYFSDKTTPSCFIESISPPESIKQFRVIQVVGASGSGKTEACSLLEKEFNYKAIRASLVLKKILGYKQDEQISREQMQTEGYKFINSKNGHEILASEIFKIIKSNKKQHWVVDGLRFPKTVDVLEKMYGVKIPIIYIETFIDNLYKYYTDREHTHRSFQEFQQIFYHPVEREIERFLHKADIIIYNHSSLEEYMIKLRDFLLNECGL